MSKRENLHKYENQTSVCEKCGIFVDTDVVEENKVVYFIKHCPHCGSHKTKICIDARYYQASLISDFHFLHCDDSKIKRVKGCPYDCGICEHHRQKVCMAMVETTDDCDILCTTCIASSCPGGKKYISLYDLQSIIDTVKRLQGNVDLLMLSGGEPAIHPQIFELLDLCRKANVKHTMLITNGVKIAHDEVFVKKLAERKKGIEIYLQFDSLRNSSLLDIRGNDVSEELRRKAVYNLEKYGIHYTLVCVIKKGVNDTEIKEILDFALAQKYARGVTFQPLKDIGRGSVYNKEANYLTLSDLRHLIGKSGHIPLNEMIPHPCNGTCISIGYLAKDRTPITNYLYSQFENREILKELMYYLPYLDTEEIKYDELLRISVVSFLDKYNFTLNAVKRCCICFVYPNGKIVPFDTHYVYHNENI